MPYRLSNTVAGLACCFTLLLTCAVAAAGPAPEQAPVAEAEDAVQTVAVTETRDPVWKSYRKLLKGMDAFDRLHALAPNAALKFVVRPQQAQLSMAGLQMKIIGDHTDMVLPIADDNTFVIPRSAAAADDDAELRLNRSQKLYRFRPDIHTPGLAPQTRRLGDLRLECEVRWAVDKFDMSFLSAAFLTPLGGACHSSRARLWHTMPETFTSVTLSHGGRQEKLAAARLDPTDHHRYSPPLHDDSWPDDTLLMFD